MNMYDTENDRMKPKSDPKTINKSFLLNTICSVESHNRREEIDECWRAHSLSKRPRIDSSFQEREMKREMDTVRDEWAAKKMAAFNALSANDGAYPTDSSDSTSNSVVDSKTLSKSKSKREEKKEKKRRKEKKKSKKSKNKKKHKEDRDLH